MFTPLPVRLARLGWTFYFYDIAKMGLSMTRSFTEDKRSYYPTEDINAMGLPANSKKEQLRQYFL